MLSFGFYVINFIIIVLMKHLIRMHNFITVVCSYKLLIENSKIVLCVLII